MLYACFFADLFLHSKKMTLLWFGVTLSAALLRLYVDLVVYRQFASVELGVAVPISS